MPQVQTLHPIDPALHRALIEENHALRTMLSQVSAVGASMMYQTYRQDCNFTAAFLKSILDITHEVEINSVQHIYEQGHEMALAPSVLDQNLQSITGSKI